MACRAATTPTGDHRVDEPMRDQLMAHRRRRSVERVGVIDDEERTNRAPSVRQCLDRRRHRVVVGRGPDHVAQRCERQGIATCRPHDPPDRADTTTLVGGPCGDPALTHTVAAHHHHEPRGAQSGPDLVHDVIATHKRQ